MKALMLLSALALISSSVIAREITHHFVREIAIARNVVIPESELDIVGVKLASKSTKEELMAQCEERDEKGVCHKVSYVFKTQGKNYAIYGDWHAGPKIMTNLDQLTQETHVKRLKKKKIENYYHITNKDNKLMDSNFLTSFLLFAAIYDSGAIPLLIFLPITATVDVAILPVTGSWDLAYRIAAGKIARESLSTINSERNEIKLLSHKRFDAALEILLYEYTGNTN